MTPDPFSSDMLDFIRALEAHRVRYLLIGGYAVHVHGHVRVTSDIDFAFSPDPENARRMFAALVTFWGDEIPNVHSPEDLQEPTMVFQFGNKPNRIDLLNSVKGVDFEEAWSRRIVEPLDGTEVVVCVIGLVDLRRSKAAAGRLKDLDDLLNLPEPIEDPTPG